MGLTTYATISLIGALSALSQYFLKTGLTAAAARPDGGMLGLLMRVSITPAFLIALLLYVACFGLYLSVLAKADVSQIFPATIGVNILFVALAAIFMLGETMTISRSAGMLSIVIGVYLVARS